MIDRIKRINAFLKLGEYIKDPTNSIEIEELVEKAYSINTWFTTLHVRKSLDAIVNIFLDPVNLKRFADMYSEPTESKKVGVVMAGNIPAVGFHDALCVLLSGHILLAKLSKNDFVLMHYLLSTLKKLEPELADYIVLVDRINEAQAYIATGSDNTARYFMYYFASKPHIIRKNRTSVAVLTGQESRQELRLLGEDILLYFGLGCRNVSKLYVPEGYDFTEFFEAMEEKRDQYANHNKFFNNYEYNKAVLLVNRTEHLDNGFLIMTRKEALVSPLSIVYFDYYQSTEGLLNELSLHAEKIQCVVGEPSQLPDAVPFGDAQSPGMGDFADGIDTMAFLERL